MPHSLSSIQTVILPSCKMYIWCDQEYNINIMWFFIHLVASTASLGHDSLRDILEVLWCIRDKWHKLGLALGIDSTTLNAILKDNRGITDDCFMELLDKWLRRKKHCWEEIAVALRSPLVGVVVKEGILYILLCFSVSCVELL